MLARYCIGLSATHVLPNSYVCFSVLLNLAEDIHTERKMVKRKIVCFLAMVGSAIMSACSIKDFKLIAWYAGFRCSTAWHRIW